MTNLDSDTTLALLRLALSGDKVMVAFDLDGVTHKLPNPMTPKEAKYALTCALDLGATRTSISRFDSFDDEGCEGHESLAGEHMGEAVYCDGSCKR